MTQLFIGHKPGVGPVVKVLKYDSDDALTLANDAYDRYFFNSENQRLTQIAASYSFDYWQMSDFPTSGVYHYGGDASTAKISVNIDKSREYDNLDIILRLDNLRAGLTFPPVCEWRGALHSDGEMYVARRTYGQWSGGGNRNRGYTFYNSFTALAKVKGYTSDTSIWAQPNWNRYVHTSLSDFVAIGDYTLLGGALEANFMGEARGLYGAGCKLTASPGTWGRTDVVHIWNLPADSTPLPSYVHAPNLESVRISQTKVAIARPGYDVATAEGPNQLILDSDSDSSQAICIAAGAVDIAAASAVFVPNPTDIPLSVATVADMIVKRQGELQYVPAYHPVFTSPSAGFGVSYSVGSGGVTIHNHSGFAVTVTYMIFNADPIQGRSSGGEKVMYRGNDGVRDFIQIKRPGSSDSDIRPSDILLDTRFPTVHILQDGWLPIADFSSTTGYEYMRLGRAKKVVPISIPAGVIPFIKFTTVFPDHILQPFFCIGYADTTGGDIPKGASRQSSLCVLDEANAEARFYLNPGSWTIVNNSGFGGSSPDPLGIRYYLFGLPTT